MHSGDVVEFDDDNHPPSMKHLYVYMYRNMYLHQSLHLEL
jgi:hypothetical protein